MDYLDTLAGIREMKMKARCTWFSMGAASGAFLTWCALALHRDQASQPVVLASSPSASISSTSAPLVATSPSPVNRLGLLGGVSLVWTSGLGRAFYVTNLDPLTIMLSSPRSTNSQAAFAPRRWWYVGGKRVSEPPQFNISGPWVQRLDPPAPADAAALHSYIERMQSRSVDTLDNVNPPPKLDLDLNR
jgi:hypothetical protein